MKNLAEALSLFRMSNSCAVVKLPLSEQRRITPMLLEMKRKGFVYLCSAADHPYPIDAILSDEGYRLRTDLLGITIPWPK